MTYVFPHNKYLLNILKNSKDFKIYEMSSLNCNLEYVSQDLVIKKLNKNIIFLNLLNFYNKCIKK